MGGFGGEAGILDDAIGVVKTDLVHEDPVEADGLEVGGVLDGAEVVAVALAERKDSAAGAEGLLPEVREGGGGGVGRRG